MRKASLLVLALLAALVAAGCGGGSSTGSESEDGARKKLEAAGQKLTDAKSFRVEVPIEAETDGEQQDVACLELGVDNHGKPERFDLILFDTNCSGGFEAHELIAVGHDAWASSSTDPGKWTAATISASLLDELDDEQTDLAGLFKAAENVETEAGGASIDEGDGTAVEGTSYHFEAPASAFPNADSDLGDITIEFDATLDPKGYLRELVVHGEEDGTGATVTDRYTKIDEPLGIEPPKPSEVEGKKTRIDSEADLDALFGSP
jgi:hypothetical protein